MKVDFEFELGALWVCMMAKVQIVLAPFLAFALFYNVNKVHNMLALVLDPCFKFLDINVCWTCKSDTNVVEYENKNLWASDFKCIYFA